MSNHARKSAIDHAKNTECIHCNERAWNGYHAVVDAHQLMTALSTARGGVVTYEHPPKVEAVKPAPVPRVVANRSVPKPAPRLMGLPSTTEASHQRTRGRRQVLRPITIVFGCSCVYFPEWEPDHAATDRDWAAWEAGRRECPKHDSVGWRAMTRSGNEHELLLARAMRNWETQILSDVAG